MSLVEELLEKLPSEIKVDGVGVGELTITKPTYEGKVMWWVDYPNRYDDLYSVLAPTDFDYTDTLEEALAQVYNRLVARKLIPPIVKA